MQRAAGCNAIHIGHVIGGAAQLRQTSGRELCAVRVVLHVLQRGFGRRFDVRVRLGDFAIARREISDEELRPGAFVSGPSQFSLADAALWYLVFGATGRIEPMALTSELSIRFLRPAQGKVLWAKATLDVAGRRNVVGTIRVWCDDRSDRPTATAQGTYVLPL